MRDKLYISVILEAIDSINAFISDLDKDKFSNDDLRRSAVIQKLVVIGTAVTRLSPDFQQKIKNLDIPIKSMAKFRFIGLHHYFEKVDDNLLWVSIKKDLPMFKEKFLKIKEKYD